MSRPIRVGRLNWFHTPYYYECSGCGEERMYAAWEDAVYMAHRHACEAIIALILDALIEAGAP